VAIAVAMVVSTVLIIMNVFPNPGNLNCFDSGRINKAGKNDLKFGHGYKKEIN
jgi:hypothetical protein